MLVAGHTTMKPACRSLSLRPLRARTAGPSLPPNPPGHRTPDLPGIGGGPPPPEKSGMGVGVGIGGSVPCNPRAPLHGTPGPSRAASAPGQPARPLPVSQSDSPASARPRPSPSETHDATQRTSADPGACASPPSDSGTLEDPAPLWQVTVAGPRSPPENCKWRRPHVAVKAKLRCKPARRSVVLQACPQGVPPECQCSRRSSDRGRRRVALRPIVTQCVHWHC